MRPKSVIESIDTGAWVYSHSPGIWQVYRVIQGVQKLRFNLHDRQRVDKRQLVFSKRLVDEDWKPGFKNEIAVVELSSAFLSQTSSDLINSSPKNLKSFCNSKHLSQTL